MAFFYEEIGMDFRIHESDYKYCSACNEYHFHECYEFYYLTEGSVFYHIGDSVYSIEKGDAVFIPPNVSHRTSSNNDERHKRILMYINPEYIKDFIKSDSNMNSFFYKTNNIKLNQKEKNFTEFVLDKIIEEFSKTPKHNETSIKSYLAALFLSLNDCVKNSENIEAKSISERMNNIIEYINKNFASEITLSTLSKEFYLHPSYISNMIKKNLGVTFIEYLNKIRIQKSIKLLLTTDYKIEDISDMCGFSSSSRYCKIFASYVSVSPTKYRKINEKND